MPDNDEASSRARSLGQVLRSFGVSSSDAAQSFERAMSSARTPDAADSLAYARAQGPHLDQLARTFGLRRGLIPDHDQRPIYGAEGDFPLAHQPIRTRPESDEEFRDRMYRSLGETWRGPQEVLTPAQAAERIHRQLVEAGILNPHDMDVRAEIDPIDPRRMNISVVARMHGTMMDGQMVPGVIEVINEAPSPPLRSRWAMVDEDDFDDFEEIAA